MTSFTYLTIELIMEQDPLAPRNYEESQISASAYDSIGIMYAYDYSTLIYRTETLIFPTITWDGLQNLISFIDNTLDGSYNEFVWVDRTSISRTARYKGLNYVQISPLYYTLNLTLEVIS